VFFVRGTDKTAGWEWYTQYNTGCGNVKVGDNSYEEVFAHNECKSSSGDWRRLATSSEARLYREDTFDVKLSNAVKKGNPITISLNSQSSSLVRSSSTRISWDVKNAHNCTASSTPALPSWV